jgi:hypothetical protein
LLTIGGRFFFGLGVPDGLSQHLTELNFSEGLRAGAALLKFCHHYMWGLESKIQGYGGSRSQANRPHEGVALVHRQPRPDAVVILYFAIHEFEPLINRVVRLLPHRLMLRPRESHELRLMSSNVTVTPPAALTWAHDVFGNTIATATFQSTASNLVIASVAELQLDAVAWPVFDIAVSAMSYPFRYSDDDWTDLGALALPQFSDPAGVLRNWAQMFVRGSRTDTLSLLKDLSIGVPDDMHRAPTAQSLIPPPRSGSLVEAAARCHPRSARSPTPAYFVPVQIGCAAKFRASTPTLLSRPGSGPTRQRLPLREAVQPSS